MQALPIKLPQHRPEAGADSTASWGLGNVYRREVVEIFMIKTRVTSTLDLIKREFDVLELRQVDLPAMPNVLVFRPCWGYFCHVPRSLVSESLVNFTYGSLICTPEGSTQ